MRRIIILMALLALFCACDDSDEEKDMTYPEISVDGTPTDGQRYHRGDTICMSCSFSDNLELGKYNIEIHNNFDHHTHSTSSVDVDLDEDKEAVNPWVFNQDYDIPSGLTSYSPSVCIVVPDNIDTGDYHFMIRLTDHVGWQQIKSVSIKIIE